MMKISNELSNTVYIRRCEEYDRDAILKLVNDGMQELNYSPKGKVFVKPNVVFASKDKKLDSPAYTDLAIVNAALTAIADIGGVSRVDIGEKTGIGIPTRLHYKAAEYYKEVRKVNKQASVPVNLFCIEEELRDRVFLGGIVHANLRAARRMARSDTMVYLPKLKCHNITNMTGAVKLNVGIMSDDERSIRHDFMLIDKIVDLLAVGYPDFIVMDAIDVGVAEEVLPIPRRLGLVIMGRNPIAVDIVGSRLLGYETEDIPYLKRAVERGYTPGRLDEINLKGDITTVEELDNQAKRIQPYDDEFYMWKDLEKELKNFKTPLRFFWGNSRHDKKIKCEYGCIMALKSYLNIIERYSGPEVFKSAKPAVLVIGEITEQIDANGHEAFLIGSCSKAPIINAKKIIKIDKCFMGCSDLTPILRSRLGLPFPLLTPSFLSKHIYNMLISSIVKTAKLRYFQDIGFFFSDTFMRKL
ncbi:MAG: DUF362 domain-containing protein [Proteobacteria bacterium]|nr:DUF362 domain-containing protein [Pseudomonadota bacterium]